MGACTNEVHRRRGERALKFCALLALALATVSLGATTVLGQEPGQVRVFVGYKPGQKAAVREALVAAGGRIHHEFDDLSVFAVTLPRAALAVIERNPQVAYVEADPPRSPQGKSNADRSPKADAPYVHQNK